MSRLIPVAWSQKKLNKRRCSLWQTTIFKYEFPFDKIREKNPHVGDIKPTHKDILCVIWLQMLLNGCNGFEMSKTNIGINFYRYISWFCIIRTRHVKLFAYTKLLNYIFALDSQCLCLITAPEMKHLCLTKPLVDELFRYGFLFLVSAWRTDRTLKYLDCRGATLTPSSLIMHVAPKVPEARSWVSI